MSIRRISSVVGLSVLAVVSTAGCKKKKVDDPKTTNPTTTSSGQGATVGTGGPTGSAIGAASIPKGNPNQAPAQGGGGTKRLSPAEGTALLSQANAEWAKGAGRDCKKIMSQVNVAM